MIKFEDNSYSGNFYTGGKALIHLEGAQRVSFTGETYENNGDNSNEAMTKYATGLLTPSSSEMTIT